MLIFCVIFEVHYLPAAAKFMLFDSAPLVAVYDNCKLYQFTKKLAANSC